jgi:hypothetical protein
MHKPTDKPAFITLSQASAALHEEPGCTWRRIMRGELVGERRGSGWVVESASLETLLAERSQPA